MFEESQIYRIDHYLGMETVQNLLAYIADEVIAPLRSLKIKPGSFQIPLFAAMLTGQKVEYRGPKSTPSPNTQRFLPSGIVVFGVDYWVNKLANVA